MSKRAELLSAFVILAAVLTIAGVASAKTYNFEDTPLLHKAYEGHTTQMPPALDDLEIGTEITDETELAKLKTSNDVRISYGYAGKYEFHRFEFNIDEPVSSITQIYVLQEGYAASLTGDPGHSLYIWNYTDSEWEFVNSTSVGPPDDRILTGTLTSNLSNYIRDGSLHLLAETNSESSCPFLYTWDGISYQFIADINSDGGFGYPLASEGYALKRPHSDDYVKIDGSQLMPEDGTYRLEIAEDQNEIAYLDAVRLLAVDHSPDVEIYSPITDWYCEIPPFEIYTIKNPVTPVSATDGNGRDILPVVSEIDRESTEAHQFCFDTITVDFGDLSGAKQIKLLYNAWVDWAGGPEYAARYEYVYSHPGEQVEYMAYVEVINEAGEWERVSDAEHFGIAQAKPRTMVLDITDWFRTDDYRMRINNWYKTHIDYIAVDTSEDEEVSATELAPVSANLYWKGVSIQTSPDGKEPTIPNYYDIADITGFSVYEGKFTRYGDVLPLLAEVDDKFVIMHVGDSICINFNELPIPEGMERDYYLFSDGYYKENFVRELLGQEVSSVEPLPFHAMSNYPYSESESYPYDAEHLAYLEEYNTREFKASGGSDSHTIYTDYVKVEVATPKKSRWTTVAPNIDGDFSEGEWTNPQLLIEEPIHSHVYFMNDGEYLYICVDAANVDGGDYSPNDNDYCTLCFDTYHDELWTPGHEDAFFLQGNGNTAHLVAISPTYDLHCTDWASNHPGLQGAAGFGGSPNSGYNPLYDHRIYEFKIPLNLLETFPGDTIGFASPTGPEPGDSLPHDADTGRHNIWPAGAHINVLSTWGDLVLARPVVVGGEVYPVNKPGILVPWIGLAVALVLAGIYGARLARRRVRS